MIIVRICLVLGVWVNTQVAGAAEVRPDDGLMVSFTTSQFIKGYFPCGGVQKPLTYSKETTPGLWHVSLLFAQEEVSAIINTLKAIKELLPNLDAFSAECKAACPGITERSVRFEKAYQSILLDVNKLIENLTLHAEV